MKNLFAGSRGGVTPRDEEIMRDIFFCDRLIVPQVVHLHYPGSKTRRPYNRLNELQHKKNFLTNEVFYVDHEDEDGRPRTATLNFFSLTPKTRATIGEALAAEGLPVDRLFARLEERDPNAPLPEGRKNPDSEELRRLNPLRAEHFSKVCALYVALKGPLQKELGQSGIAWLWRNERRAYRPYTRADGPRHYRPDAELILAPSNSPRRFHLLIEVQTARSRATSDEIAEKVADYCLATTRPGFPPQDRRALVFAGETSAHLAAARNAAGRFGVPLISGSAREVASQLVGLASRIARGETPEAVPSPSPPGGVPNFGPSYKAVV